MEQRINERMDERFDQMMKQLTKWMVEIIGNQNRGHHNHEHAYDAGSVGEEEGEFSKEEAPRGRRRVVIEEDQQW